MKEEKKIKETIVLTKEELQTTINLLFTGKWSLSLQESRQVIEPIINKMSQMIDVV